MKALSQLPLKGFRLRIFCVAFLIAISGAAWEVVVESAADDPTQNSNSSQGSNQTNPSSELSPPTQSQPQDLNNIAGAANEGFVIENNQVRLNQVLPQYEVPSNIEDGAMIGAETLEDLSEGLKEAGQIHPIIKGANLVANVISAFHEASEIGLEEGDENAKAELYVLSQVSDELHTLVTEAAQRKQKPDPNKLRELQGRLQKFQSDFSDHSTSWEFFKRAVATEASGETLANELAVFGKEFGLKPLMEKFLGRAGGWLYDRAGLGAYRRWLWKEASPTLRNLLGKNAWKKFSDSSRLALYRQAASEGGKKLLPELLFGQIDLKFKSAGFDERIRIVNERVEAAPARLPPPQIVVTNSIQAIATVQNLAFAPLPALRAPVRIEMVVPALGSTVNPENSTYNSSTGSNYSTTSYSKSEWQTATSSSRMDLSNSESFRRATLIDLKIKGFDSR